MSQLGERVLAYLWRAELSEQDIWARDCLRVSWQTARLADQGCPWPYVVAFSQYFGKHPSKAIPIWLERERQWKSQPSLADELAPKKKPAKSERRLRGKRAA